MKEPIWIGEREALALHERLITTHGGAGGLRDQGLLASALARPRQHFTYDPSTSVLQLAALYTAAIVRDHPFVDGNKRTGFLTGTLFLELNGHKLTASEEDAALAVIALASGEINESQYAAFLRDNTRGQSKRR